MEYLIRVFQDELSDVVFFGCSLRDSDFYNLFNKFNRKQEGIKARITIFGTKPVDSWLDIGKTALHLKHHYFYTKKFLHTNIVYIQCCGLDKPTGGLVVDEKSNHIYVQAKDSPAQVLLGIMEDANKSTGFLQEVGNVQKCWQGTQGLKKTRSLPMVGRFPNHPKPKERDRAGTGNTYRTSSASCNWKGHPERDRLPAAGTQRTPDASGFGDDPCWLRRSDL